MIDAMALLQAALSQGQKGMGRVWRMGKEIVGNNTAWEVVPGGPQTELHHICMRDQSQMQVMGVERLPFCSK